MQRRQMILALSVLALASFTPATASAQFELCPGGRLGALTRPLRHILLHHRAHRASRHHHARETRAASRESDTTHDARPVIAGPIWPDAYAEVVGYVFWPNEYRQNLQQHGVGDIVMAVIGPLPSRATTVGTAARDTEDTDTIGDATKNADTAAVSCVSSSEKKKTWPAAKIEQAISLDTKQRETFEKLHASYLSGAKSIDSNCHDLAMLTPTRRLEATEQRLWTVRDAGVLIREPLKAFYQSLDDQQRAKFTTNNKPAPKNHDNARTTDATIGREQQECYGKESSELQRFLKTIEETVRPTQAQRESFETLRKKSSQMAKLLMASCVIPPPSTPLGRLDAADTRLTAINYAATTVDIALNDFYARLSKEQKKRFDAMGR
jgi:hypothetical protein